MTKNDEELVLVINKQLELLEQASEMTRYVAKCVDAAKDTLRHIRGQIERGTVGEFTDRKEPHAKEQ